MQAKSTLLLKTFTALALVVPAVAQTGPRVAIAAAAANDPTDCRFTGLQQKLMQTQRFAVVDILDVATRLPTLQEFEAYDAIITWSNVPYYDSDFLGTRLADYVDGGGGVVVAGFANYSTSPGMYLGGRWLTGGYEIIEHTAGLQSGPATLGQVLDASHPIGQGVTNISGMFMGRPFLMENWALAQGHVVLEWDDGRMLAAVSDTNFRRADLGLYPVDSDCVSGFLDANGDGVTLIANALLHVAGGSIATNYCAAIANSTGIPGRMILQGSSLITDNNLTLMAEDLPNGSFGFFLGGRLQGSSYPFGGGQGRLCLQTSELDLRQHVLNSGTLGSFSFQLDLSAMPTSGGNIAATAGDTWNFQAWYRDANPQMTSNLTDGSMITLR
ncbi:hypothetical protein Poly30_07250 [Planctomycetes bacterium Poly30]|uniref:Trehalose utilization n=1 Tax=Saltatorellus ferox TaxID=2528018 RepID=A0A518EMA9_9BACT|nr:hypothetical protein Poly30_07250 [Planctomycetes bacterium Poly30]